MGLLSFPAGHERGCCGAILDKNGTAVVSYWTGTEPLRFDTVQERGRYGVMLDTNGAAVVLYWTETDQHSQYS